MSEHSKWIKEQLETFAETGIMPDGTYWRATYTEEDRRGLCFLEKVLKDKGFKVYYDEVGNIIGRIEGKSEEVIMVGSHRDTVKNGGKYDGALGIITAIKCVSDLFKEKGVPNKTVEVVGLCEEEASRFLSGYIGSRAITGTLTHNNLLETDSKGISAEIAMKENGFLQNGLPKLRNDITRFIELHIEQGNILETKGKQIGIVTSIVGIYSGYVKFIGEQNHAGTTPMSTRKDPVACLAEFISYMNAFAKAQDDEITFTVGNIEITPGISNVIAKEAVMTFDMRAGKNDLLEYAVTKMQNFINNKVPGICVEVAFACQDPPIEMDETGINSLEKIASENKLEYMRINSGAGHDSQIFAEKFATNMIFVPSKDGISHSPLEETEFDDIEAGCILLKEYLKEIIW